MGDSYIYRVSVRPTRSNRKLFPPALDMAQSFPEDIKGYYWTVPLVAGVAVVVGLEVKFKLRYRHRPLPPKYRSFLTWIVRLHALFSVWFLAVLLHLGPSVVEPADKHLYMIYQADFIWRAMDAGHLAPSTTASAVHGRIAELRFLEELPTFSFLQSIGNGGDKRPPRVWILFAALDKAHQALVYGYVGGLWRLPSRRWSEGVVLKYSFEALLVSNMVCDVYGLSVHNFVAAETGKVKASRQLFWLHLYVSWSCLARMDRRVGAVAMAGYARKVPTLAASLFTKSNKHGARQSADEPGARSRARRA